MDENIKLYQLFGVDVKLYDGIAPRTVGGNKKLKIYGHLDCLSVLYYIEKGQYVKYWAFKDEETAITAEYRPYIKCMHKEYKRWKE